MNKKNKRNRKQRFKDRKSISDSEIQQKKKKDKRHWETLGYHLSFFRLHQWQAYLL